MLSYKEIIPPTVITREKKEINDFIKQNGKCVIKPLYGNGGESIFLLDKQDENYNQIIERFIDQLKEPFIIQKFLPNLDLLR